MLIGNPDRFVCVHFSLSLWIVALEEFLFNEEHLEEVRRFYSSRGAIDGTFFAKLALKQMTKHGKLSCLVFMDIMKEFDSTQRTTLKPKCRHF
jgi:hypothetical protein